MQSASAVQPSQSKHAQAARRFSRFRQLHRAMSASVVAAFCFNHPALKALLRLLCLPCTLELTRLGMKMEAKIKRDGHLRGASQWLVRIAARCLRARGARHIPRSGPLLFVGNHAGLGDAFALLAASPRRDTQLLAHDFGILPGLHELRQHVILLDQAAPMPALRRCLRHLRAGKSLLLFPRGQIEQDPALALEPALASLAHWSFSIDFFARNTPDLTIVPCAIGGVLSRRALDNAIVRRYQDQDQRQFLAATFQMMFPCYRDPVISLHFGRPLRGENARRAQALGQMARLLGSVHEQQRDLANQVP